MSDTEPDDIVCVDTEADRMTAGTGSKNGSITWDFYYNSPKADLKLISRDMTGFKVDSWLVAKKSQFVKDLLDVPSGESLDKSSIHLDYSSPTIRLFLDLVCTRHILTFNAVKLSCLGYEELFKLCDQFEAPDIAKGLVGNLQNIMRYPTTGLDPWRVFKLAAQRDDVELARLAAVKIHKSKLGFGEALFTNPPSFFNGIPSRYMAALMRSAFKSVDHLGPAAAAPVKGLWIQRNVDEVGQNFQLD